MLAVVGGGERYGRPQALRWRLVNVNVADLVDPPRRQPREMQALTPDEARAVLAAARDDDIEALWWLALTSGMRQCELLALRWPDVDLDAGSLRVVASLIRMTERRILVFDANGLISKVDRLSRKINAIVAQEEREKVSRRVRDKLRFLRRNGQLLGTIPQGYRRVDGQIVEDPESAPAIKEIFRLYATGRFSLRSLAEHLNRAGVRPNRGDGKVNHNRSKAIIFTGDVLKDLIGNPSYALVKGLHPALVDEETWRACQEIKKRNIRRTSKAWTKHTYPLTPILLCARLWRPDAW